MEGFRGSGVQGFRGSKFKVQSSKFKVQSSKFKVASVENVSGFATGFFHAFHIKRHGVHVFDKEFG